VAEACIDPGASTPEAPEWQIARQAVNVKGYRRAAGAKVSPPH